MAHHEIAAHDVGDAPADQQYRETPPGAGYEHTDANVIVIAKFGLWLAISAVVIHFGLGLMYRMLIDQANDAEQANVQYPLATGAEQRQPPEPRLQQFPRTEMYDFRTTEQRMLESYGWVDKAGGVVHIPIEQAMRMTLERGLPSRSQDPAQPGETPGMMATDSSAGRVMERRRQ